MTSRDDTQTFDLLHDDWIDVETKTGTVERTGVVALLGAAHDLRALRDPSPLYVAGLQRFLAAVVHDALGVRSLGDVVAVLRAGRFAAAPVQEWAARWGDRFDLFSPDRPFYQSGDIPLAPDKGMTVKPVGYLAPEIPCATAINHFRHVYDAGQGMCPPCAAKGLVALPAFATSGGAGIRPSINGVPPIYVLPAGQTLFETLALSLVADLFRPKLAVEPDVPLWQRKESTVARSGERLEVGYLDSLTFPARRVRLFPEAGPGACTRCGAEVEVIVRQMVFDMGESRPRDAAPWQDPFVAYRAPKGDKPPVPVRPVEGRAAWREFAALFLDTGSVGGNGHGRPKVLAQIDWLALNGVLDRNRQSTFRCIGLRTDMKAKVFEWVESGFDVPLRLLNDYEAQAAVVSAMGYAEAIADALRFAFRHFGARYVHLRTRMLDGYWMDLAEPFRATVPAVAESEGQSTALETWQATVYRCARKRLAETVDAAGETADQLRRRAVALADFDRLAAKAKTQYPTT
jgi:CRISPR system Cascade subunit CasA